jgi:hypothetical protein
MIDLKHVVFFILSNLIKEDLQYIFTLKNEKYINDKLMLAKNISSKELKIFDILKKSAFKKIHLQ